MRSSNWTAPEVDQVTHTKAFGDFPQLGATGREETAHQSIPVELLELDPPAPGATAEPLENLSQLPRDRSFSLAKKAAGVVHQIESTEVGLILGCPVQSPLRSRASLFVTFVSFCSKPFCTGDDKSRDSVNELGFVDVEQAPERNF
jgi:hypothetical protein